MSTRLTAEERQPSTKHALKELRDHGKIPAVLYGKESGVSLLAVDEKELLHLLRTQPQSVVEIELPDGGQQSAMIAEVQKEVLTGRLLHIDLHQINMNEKVRTTVRVDFVGEPAGVRDGGILQVMHHNIEIRCLPKDIPAAIEADVSRLELGQHLFAKDISMPEGIELKSSPDELMATVLLKQKEEPEDGADTEADQAAAQTKEPAAEGAS